MAATMATPYAVRLNANEPPPYAVDTLTRPQAETASELLQTDYESHHIFFNDSKFHNHIVHHITTLYAIGADEKQMRMQYDHNVDYQRPRLKTSPTATKDMNDLKVFRSHLEDAKYYPDYLAFFQAQIAEKGWKNVIKEFLLKGDERADDMLVRVYSGLLHPIIHLGFGIEFEQPVIIAEGLAQAAVHSNWMNQLFLGTEAVASGDRATGRGPSMLELIKEAVHDPIVRHAPSLEDANIIRDALLGRAKERTLQILAKYRVQPDELEDRLAEMFDANAFMTAAAQTPEKEIKFDFFLIHSLNCAVFYPTLLRADWLTREEKCRLLEWKVRHDIVNYLARNSPELRIEEISSYRPMKAGGWSDIFQRASNVPEDGHVVKGLRALKAGQEICSKKPGVIKPEMWLTMAHMLVDSTEPRSDGNNVSFIFGCGFPEKWESFPDRRKWDIKL